MVGLSRHVAIACALIFATNTAAIKTNGCGKALAYGIKTGGTGRSNNITITTSDGGHRSYLLHVPDGYSPSTGQGLIFSFHGRGESAKQQEKVSRFSDPTVNPNMIVAYPKGIKKQWQGDPAAKSNDIAFTLDMIKKISDEFCIDDDAIYATGKSNGGGFAANVLACDPVASTKIAAFGGFSGAYYVRDGKKVDKCDGSTYPIVCNPGRKPVPIFETHGSADTVIPCKGGARRGRCLPSIPHFMTSWAQRNGLDTANTTTTLAGGKVKKYEFGHNNSQGIMVQYWVQDLGHAWPDTVPNGDGCCSLINASQLAMAFFRKWTLKNTPLTNVATSSSASGTKTTDRITTTKATKTKSTHKATGTVKPFPHPVCPASNGTRWATPAKKNFDIYCGFDTAPYTHLGNPIPALHNFGKCIEACGKNPACGHVVYHDGVCYLKKGKPSSFLQLKNPPKGRFSRVAVKVS